VNRAVVAAAVAVAMLATAASSPSAPSPRLEHVFVIMLENHSDASVVGDANAPSSRGSHGSMVTRPATTA